VVLDRQHFPAVFLPRVNRNPVRPVFAIPGLLTVTIGFSFATTDL
jgi:hypothetical protein